MRTGGDPGLYACGNDMASVVGGTWVRGTTLGPAAVLPIGQ
jgi:hypothetical protein